MGIIHFGPPVELITRLLSEVEIVNFVETGTYRGETAAWASTHFKNVFSIEYSKDFYEQAAARYAHLSNVQFIYGDSRGELSKLITSLDGLTLFWLDAHWCGGGGTFGEQDQCPLLGEIEIVNQARPESLIFVDDARLFAAPPTQQFDLNQWPNISAVISTLSARHPQRYVMITEDVIVAVPEMARETVMKYGQEANHRAWVESEGNAKFVNASDLQKGLALINQDLKAKLRYPRRLLGKLFRTVKARPNGHADA
jgi:hypothetical protein